MNCCPVCSNSLPVLIFGQGIFFGKSNQNQTKDKNFSQVIVAKIVSCFLSFYFSLIHNSPFWGSREGGGSEAKNWMTLYYV